MNALQLSTIHEISLLVLAVAALLAAFALFKFATNFKAVIVDALTEYFNNLKFN